MNRLTFDGNFCEIAQCRELPCTHGGSCTQRKVWEKLKAYEDLGLEPEDYKCTLNIDIIVRAAAIALGVPVEQLCNIVKLGKAGRLMVLPEKGESDGRIRENRNSDGNHMRSVRKFISGRIFPGKMWFGEMRLDGVSQRDRRRRCAGGAWAVGASWRRRVVLLCVWICYHH